MKASTVLQVISQFDETANNDSKTILKHNIASTMLTKDHLVTLLSIITEGFGETDQQQNLINEFESGSIDVMDAIFSIIDLMDIGSADSLLGSYDDVMDAVLDITVK
jgi:hypothetical protein